MNGLSQKKLDAFIKSQPKAFTKAVKTGLLRIGLDVRSNAGSKAPYLSGTLRRSLTSKNHSDAIYEHSSNGRTQSVAVGSNLAYARIQDKGGRTGRGGKGKRGRQGATKIAGTGFLTKSFNQMKNGPGSKIMDQEIEAAINKIS